MHQWWIEHRCTNGGSLVHRALMICTKHRLNGEIERIKKILPNNGYPKNVINAQIAKKIAQFSTLKRFGLEKCPVRLRVPWIGKLSTNLEKKSTPPWKAAMVPSAPAWSLRQSACYQCPARMFYLPLRKVLSYINISATVIVGTWGEHLNDYTIASSNMFRNS